MTTTEIKLFTTKGFVIRAGIAQLVEQLICNQ